jgi:hypothetical protein
MLTKLMAAAVMIGALWVAGDSLYREFGSCDGTSGCASRVRQAPDCCSSTSGGCCEVTRSMCCSQSAASTSNCCDSVYTYCTRTGEVNLGSCCEVVDGRYRCRTSGEMLDECCCVPIPD